MEPKRMPTSLSGYFHSIPSFWKLWPSPAASMEYKSLAVDESQDGNPPDPEFTEQMLKREQQAEQKRHLLYMIILLLFVFCLMLIPTMIGLSSTSNKTAAVKQKYRGWHCGNSTAEARALGCEFEFLSYSWTPAPCFDRETSAEFVAWAQQTDRLFGAWPIFADRDGQQHIPDLNALSEQAPASGYTSQELHLAHCIFWMRYMERVIDGSAALTSRGDSLGHAMHCSEQLLERLDGEDAKYREAPHSVFDIGFNTC